MKTIIVSVIGISSIFLVAMIQNNINTKTWQEEQLENSLAEAMSQTMEEVIFGGGYGISNQNEMMAAFLQAMIRKLDGKADVTIKVHDINFALGQMDIEAIGSYRMTNGKTCKVSVRRNLWRQYFNMRGKKICHRQAYH